ncbi:IS110 family transposase [bacterium]|nr:IS110 family transposase [bacterium]
MEHYVGLDVSLKSIFVCIVNEKGKIVKEQELPSTPEAIGSFLQETDLEIEKIGLESGNLTHYLKKGLKKMGYEVIGMESRKMAAILATIINKTDKNDARGIAEALRVGHYRECIHRSDEAVEIRSVLHARQTAIEQRTHLLSSIKGHVKMYGIKLGKGKTKTFREKVEKTISSLKPSVQQSIKCLLNILDVVEKEIKKLDRESIALGKKQTDVRILQTIDGVGPITALAFKAEIDDPKRFEDSKDVAAYIGLTPSQYSSGEIQRQGGISKRGSRRMRCLLVEAATCLLTRSKVWSKLKAWGMKLMKKKGKKKAIIAVARKLAVTMHRMLITQQPFMRTDKKAELKAA